MMMSIIAILLIANNVFTKEPCVDSIDLAYCKHAYEYLENQPCFVNKSLYASDTLVYLDYVDFYNELESQFNLCFKKNFLSIDSLDKVLYFKNCWFNKIKAGLMSSNGNYIIFFSKPYCKTLIAEIVPTINYKRKSYRELVAFNQAQIYLFEFDENKKIIRTYTKEKAYD